MSASHAENISSGAAENLDIIEGINPEVKHVDPDDPYEYAPPKDGDPWTTLLTPELEADTMRCNAWKEEVQNLLIFAGLFSAVVTAFVIESYKFLQPDPNAAVVGLLFQIANSLNNTFTLPSSVTPESILTPFSQKASSIRINVFWFLSLILSLTTVLVGTIALQWLREHQSYVGYSSKEKLAILHMRSQAAEAWYLPQVFAALPLLLQGALVLFLAGLIDFSQPLGLKLTIPVSIIIGITLLFLAATTVLPTLQCFSFLSGLYPRKTLPTPCPFKSPQSHALRMLYGIVLRAVFSIIPLPGLDYAPNPPNSDSWEWIITNPPLFMADHLAPPVYNLWYRQTWLSFDREWLSLRDACHQGILDGDASLYHHRTRWEDDFPLSDVVQCLVEAVNQTPGSKHTESFLAALVQCFQELSESIWTARQIGRDFQRKDRRNRYFEKLHFMPSCSMSTFLLHGGTYKFDKFYRPNIDELSDYIEPKVMQRLFSDDQTVIFLERLLNNHSSSVLSQYQLELWLRLLQYCSRIAPLTTGPDDLPVATPTLIGRSIIYSMVSSPLSGRRYSSVADAVSTLLGLAASHHISNDQSMKSLFTHPQMADVLYSLASLTDDYLRLARNKDTTLATQNALRDIGDQFIRLFNFIGDRLKASNSENPFDIFFYFSSIFIWELLDWTPAVEILGNKDSNFGQALKSLLLTLHNTSSSGRKNDSIEKRFKGGDDDGEGRFSENWWNRLFIHIPKDETPPRSRGASLSKTAIAAENAITLSGSHLPTSPWVVENSPVSNTRPLDGDNKFAITPSNFQPESSGSLNLNIHIDNDVLNHPPTTIAWLDPAIDLLTSGPKHTSDKPDDHHAAEEAPLPTNGVVPQEVTTNRTLRSELHSLQPGVLHFAIEVGEPTIVEHVDVDVQLSGGNRPADEAREEAIIHVRSL